MSELTLIAELFVVLKHAHRPGTGRRQTGEPEQSATEFLRVRVDGIKVNRGATAPRMIVGKVDTTTFVYCRARSTAT